jgi:hypothetical protein
MEGKGNKHENYEILNLVGYGLSKFNDEFITEFGFKTKTAFYEYCIEIGIAETVGTVKNRMDLFDHSRYSRFQSRITNKKDFQS